MEEHARGQVTVLLVDDHAAWRGGVRSMLEDSEFEVVGEAASGHEAVKMVEILQPKLVLLDIRMPDGDGLEALHAIKSRLPRTAVVMLTTYSNPSYVDRAVAGGAAGYLMKGVGRDELLNALRQVSDGEMLLKKEELERSLNSLVSSEATAPTRRVELSERECELLRLIRVGLSNHDIAAVMPSNHASVRKEVDGIIEKLNVSDRVQAAVWACRHGVTPHIGASGCGG